MCTADAGREGELIFRLVYHKAGCRKPFERLWISSMENVAINYEFTYPEQVMIYAQRPNATFCKPYEDWNAENYRRYVKRGSTGIALFVMNRDRDPIGVTALIANSTVPPIAVRAEIITEEDKDVLKIEVPRSRGGVSTASGKILRRRNKLDGSPEVIPMYSYEIPSRLAELGMLDYSAQPLAGATLDDLDPNQRVRLRQIIQNRSGGEKTLLSLPDEELDIALRLITNVAGNYVPSL